MSKFQKVGGVSALAAAATFVFGFVLALAVIGPAEYGSVAADPMENIAFLAENEALLYLWYLVIYVAFGAFLVVAVLALSERLKDAIGLTRTAAAFGLIWAGLVIASGMVANIGAGVVLDVYGRDAAQAGSTWLALSFVVDGLGGGNEIVGGLWVLLVSLAALRTRGLPRVLNYLGIVVSAAGLITVVPALGEIGGTIFGMGSIVWFVWLGIAMFRPVPSQTAVSGPSSVERPR